MRWAASPLLRSFLPTGTWLFIVRFLPGWPYRRNQEQTMILLFGVATLIAVGSFLLLSGTVLPGFHLMGEAAAILFVSSSVIAVGSALAIDA
jgi:hypothetical protein